MALGNKSSITADHFRPIKDNVFVCDLDSGPHVTAGGIIRPDDNMSETGIHPRWARVWAMGPDVEGIEINEWVYIEHARWTNSIDLNLPNGRIRVWKIDWPAAVLLAAPEDPREQRLTELPKVERLQSTKHLVRSKTPSIIRRREF